jgi:hydrogenase maturation protease
VLVLGIGNILLADEGVGVHAVEAFRRRYPAIPAVEVVDGGTAGLDLIDIVAGRDHLIVVDAARTGGAPGTIIRLAEGSLAAGFGKGLSPHDLGFTDMLAALTLIGDEPVPPMTVFGIEPAEVHPSLNLSATCSAAVDKVVIAIADELRRLGIALPDG